MNEQINCMGCGVPLQTKDKTRLGYTPIAALKRKNIVCQRCFRLKNYNDIQNVTLSNKDFLEIVKQIGKRKALIVKIVDIFDFNGSWLQEIHDFIGNNDVMLIGNKIDLLPKSVNRNRLIAWMKSQAEERGIKPVSVHVVSAEKNEGLSEVATEIEQKRGKNDVYVIGCTNVGKSTFINRLIKILEYSNDERLTTSRFPGTTLDLIKIPLNETDALYDTPGIINDHQFVHYVDQDELKIITPIKEIKPKTYQLHAKQSLFVGGLARFDFVSGDKTSFVCYFANELMLHRTKLENADELYQRQKGRLLVPPKIDNIETYPNLKKHHFLIKGTKTDIVFSGLGWITVMNSHVNIVAHAPTGVTVLTRSSLI